MADVEGPAPVEVAQVDVAATEATKEPPPSVEPPADDDSDAVVALADTPDGPPGDTVTAITADTAPPDLGDTVTTAADGTALGETITAATDDTAIPAAGDTVAPLADGNGLPTLEDTVAPLAGDTGLPELDDTVASITGDITIAPLPDAVTTATDDTIATATGGTGLPALDDTSLPALDDTVASITDDTGLPALDDTVASITDDITIAPLPDAITTITDDTALPALDDTLATITDDAGVAALGSLTHSVGAVGDAAGLDALTGGLAEVASPLVTTVETATTPLIGDSALEIGSPLTTMLDASDASLGDIVAGVTAPFVVAVPSAGPQRSTGLTDDGTGATLGGDSSTDGSVTPGTHALVDGAAVSAAPATAAPGADAIIDPAAVFGPALVPTGTADPSLRLDVAAPGAVPGTTADPAIDPSGAFADAPSIVLGAPVSGPSVLPDPGMADPLSPTDSALAAIAEAAPDVRILVSAAVLAMAAAAMVGPRAGGSGADVSMVFTNVRLLPCVVKESLARHVELLTAATTVGGGSGASAASPAADLLGSASGTRGAAAEGTAGKAERVQDAFQAALESFRDGFERAIGDEAEDVGEGFRDSRLMLQLGMLLGFAYVGFLSIWFWATRVRGSRRTDAM